MIGIIGAMVEEIIRLKEAMAEIEIIELANKTFYKGKLAGKTIVLVESGIGKVNAALVTTLLLNHFPINLLINTGTAGSLDPAVKLGDVVIAHSLTYHDVDVTGFGYERGQMAGMPSLYYPDSQLIRLSQAVVRGMGIEPIVGQIVSGDQFINSIEKTQEIRASFPRARACEMESTAIAQVAQVLEVPFVIIRAISDNADHYASVSFDDFVLEAGAKSAQMVASLLAVVD
ncbi:5'-methylthioadenosine/adenosylhomocysteine nucleosidase [Eremococcus coleocola]|uniref:5'-methylthioadenosine/adenosylhomocysteine nucleosidase n=1 Tax=Eremococcus coleocola TaxID=88132 RepID=UPI000416F214|nr:5'-methylthioadenosine/adenosylhomocysteine nucleosidase [Eremococcus coleocola]